MSGICSDFSVSASESLSPRRERTTCLPSGPPWTAPRVFTHSPTASKTIRSSRACSGTWPSGAFAGSAKPADRPRARSCHQAPTAMSSLCWLTSFASKTRYRIINDGGMLYQFGGDSVVGLFGVPEAVPGHVGHAFECARGLVDIGASVATGWQRQIDQIQSAAGVHVSMTLGDLQVLSLRPLSRTHMGVIGDSINLAARLNSVAGSTSAYPTTFAQGS